MYRHRPNCLQGPFSRAYPWWLTAKDGDPSIRVALVERVRREIAAGTYETPEKWEAALDQLFLRLQDD